MVKGLAVGHGSLFANVAKMPLGGGLKTDHMVSEELGTAQFQYVKKDDDIVAIIATQRSASPVTQVAALLTREVLEEALKTLGIA